MLTENLPLKDLGCVLISFLKLLCCWELSVQNLISLLFMLQDGKSASDVASAYGNPNICALLKKHMKQRRR